jgi:hypothetical protein
MSTLQQTSQHHMNQRSMLAVAIAFFASAAVVVVLLVSAGNGSSSIGISGPGTGAMHGTPQQQLQAVAGPRYHVSQTAPPQRPEVTRATPQQQLQAVAGPRYYHQLELPAPTR